VTYVTIWCACRRQDHDVQFYADAGAELTVNATRAQQDLVARFGGATTALRMGSSITVLAGAADDLH